MKPVRDGLHQNFLPLIDAVEAVARRIDDISVANVDAHRSLNGPTDGADFEVKMQRAAVYRMLQHARAADRLFHLLNRRGASRPQWFKSVYGYAMADDSADQQGREFLARLANLSAPSATAGRPAGSIDEPPTLLGFDADEFIRFLDANQVPHTLGVPLEQESDEPNEVQPETGEHFQPTHVDVNQAPQTLSDLLHEDADEPNENPAEIEATTQPPNKTPADLEFKGVLADALHEAVKTANDPWSPRSVFYKLTELVGDRRFPALKEIVDGEVKYDDKGEIFFFTKKNMSDRYRQLRKK